MLRTKLTILLIIILLFTVTGCGQKDSVETKPITLTWWRVWDTSDKFSQIIHDYKAEHPHISIAYKKLRYEEYEQMLLEAWAEDAGPDIFSVPTVWLKKYQSRIVPMPENTKVPTLRVTGPSWKRSEEVINPITPGLTLGDIKRDWVPTVYDDVVFEGKIWGLPLGVDTLVLFYNRDLLDRAKIVYPPKTWVEFKEQVKKLTLIDEAGNIVQAGAALGTALNVTRYTDILSLLMMQNGVEMPDFNLASKFDSNYFPGQEALRFYWSFSDPTKEVYTWNEELPDSLEAFIQGKLAFFFGYSYHLPIIQARAPKLNFEIAPAPQISGTGGEINYANYWVEVVARKSPHQNEAWNFVQFTTSAGKVNSHLEQAKKPTALRALILEQEKDYDLKVFTEQLLNAKSWYQGKDFNLVEDIFKEMVTSVHKGETTVLEAVNFAVQQVKMTY